MHLYFAHRGSVTETQIRSSLGHRTNVEPLSTSFFGRGDELGWLLRAVETGDRLITVVGPPGCGKTRLGLEFAHRHVLGHGLAEPRAAWFFDLIEARQIDDMVTAIIEALGLSVQPERTDHRSVVHAGQILAGQGSCVLLFDNLEPILDEARSALKQWMGQARSAVFLVTSRTVLGLRGERVLQLQPLPVALDRTNGEGDSRAAVDLFFERAQAVRPSFRLTEENGPVVEQIVQRVDGLPLAIELAAARIAVFSPEALLERLERQLEVLTRPHRDALSHHQTLLGAIEWSWDQLSAPEKSVMAQTTVFRSGFDVAAAEAVLEVGGEADAPEIVDLLHSLVEKSLLVTGSDRRSEGVRFSMLRSIADFASDRVSTPSDVEGPRWRHAIYFTQRAEDWLQAIRLWDDRQSEENLFTERHNLLAAYEYCLDRLGGKDTAGRRRAELIESSWSIIRSGQNQRSHRIKRGRDSIRLQQESA